MTRISEIANESMSLWVQKGYFSSSKFWRVIVRVPTLLRNLPVQYAVLQAFWSCKMSGLAIKQPILPFKYLKGNYLARGLTVSDRATALVYNYTYLHATLRDDFIRKVLYKGAPLFEKIEDHHRYLVEWDLSSPCYSEGELSLSFKMDGVTLYLLSFTFVPGEIVGLPDPTVLLITRLQGTYGCYPQIRKAMKSLNGLSLPMLLIVVLEGLATAFDIQHWAGIPVSRQYMPSDVQISAIRNVYDNFFTTLGATWDGSGFFCGSFPLMEKPLHLVHSCNRSRSKMQRKLKRQVSGDVSLHLSQQKWVKKRHVTLTALHRPACQP